MIEDKSSDIANYSITATEDLLTTLKTTPKLTYEGRVKLIEDTIKRAIEHGLNLRVKYDNQSPEHIG